MNHNDSIIIPPLTAERTGPGCYVVRNPRGAELRVGLPGAEGSFSPVELLQAAAAGCAALSADSLLISRLGEDFRATATVDAAYNAEENRVERLLTHIVTDMTKLEPETRDKLIASAGRAIDRLCTVKRSVNHGIENPTEVGHERATD